MAGRVENFASWRDWVKLAFVALSLFKEIDCPDHDSENFLFSEFPIKIPQRLIPSNGFKCSKSMQKSASILSNHSFSSFPRQFFTRFEVVCQLLYALCVYPQTWKMSTKMSLATFGVGKSFSKAPTWSSEFQLCVIFSFISSDWKFISKNFSARKIFLCFSFPCFQ